MTVVPFPLRTTWVADARGDGRAVRVSAHRQAGLVVLSVWNRDTCTATVHLQPEDVVEVVTALTRSLVDLEQAPEVQASPAAGPPAS